MLFNFNCLSVNIDICIACESMTKHSSTICITLGGPILSV